MSKSLNVLVVGGAGYIGSHCVRRILAAGHRPVILDSLIYGHRKSIPAGVAFHQGDMADRPFVRDVLRREKIDVVMHFAAFINVGESVTDPLKYYKNNVVATLTLLETMLEENVKKFVFSSTAAVFGIPEVMPIREDAAKKPINPVRSDQTRLRKHPRRTRRLPRPQLRRLPLLQRLRRLRGRRHRRRPHAGVPSHPERHSRRARPRPRPSRSSAPTTRRRTAPACATTSTSTTSPARTSPPSTNSTNPASRSPYNLGTGKPLSVLEIIKAVEKVSGKKVPVEYGPRRAGDPATLCADATKARAELGWAPKFEYGRADHRNRWRWHSTRPEGYGDR